MMGVTDLLGPGGGPNLKVELPFLVSVFLACQVALYLLASLHAQKAFYFGHPSAGMCQGKALHEYKDHIQKGQGRVRSQKATMK